MAVSLICSTDDIDAVPQNFKGYDLPELHLKTQSVPRSKHTPSRL
jgi:hypothetical protein